MPPSPHLIKEFISNMTKYIIAMKKFESESGTFWIILKAQVLSDFRVKLGVTWEWFHGKFFDFFHSFWKCMWDVFSNSGTLWIMLTVNFGLLEKICEKSFWHLILDFSGKFESKLGMFSVVMRVNLGHYESNYGPAYSIIIRRKGTLRDFTNLHFNSLNNFKSFWLWSFSVTGWRYHTVAISSTTSIPIHSLTLQSSGPLRCTEERSSR